MNILQSKRLKEAQSIWKYAINHPSYAMWYQNAAYNYEFFSGIGNKQWTESDIQVIHERGQLPLTFNLIPSFVNALCGVEIQSRFRIGCRIDRADRQDNEGEASFSELSKALTHLLLTWQNKEKVPEQGTWKFLDAMICGLAWSAVYKEDGATRYKHCSSLEVIPDFDDMSLQFESMKYVCKEWYLPRDEILKRWKNVKLGIDFKTDQLLDQFLKSEALEKYSRNLGYQPNLRSVNPLVCEVQHREAKTAYAGTMKHDGRYFETFDPEQAEELAENKSSITEFESTQIIRTLFIGDTLLESAPLEPSFPNQKDFSFIPFVWAKSRLDNIPYGFIEPLKAIQMDLNKRVTNSIYYMLSNQYIIEGQKIEGPDLAKLKKTLGNRNAIIQVPVGSKITVNSSIPLGEEQIKIVREYLELFQRISGIQDEMLGIQTNATSGLAQKVRQVNSVRTNIFAFDNLSYMKQREALVAVQLFQNSFYENFCVNILEDNEIRELYLNLVVENWQGKKKVINNVNFLPVTLYFEEMHNIVSTLDDIREGAVIVAQNPNLLQMPSLLKDLGLRHADKYVQDYQQAQQQLLTQRQSGGQSIQIPSNQTTMITQ